MALKVREIPDLMDKNKITLVAGRNGLERDIFSVGIADYEFLDGFDYSVEDEFEPDCFVISSLIFAQGHPEKILYALKILFHSGVSGLAFKEALFQKLPPEAISFANANDFPIFSFPSMFSSCSIFLPLSFSLTGFFANLSIISLLK